MITREDVLHVAKLARLALSEEEIERFQGQLDAILQAVSKVSELDLSDVPPTSHPLGARERAGRGRAGAVARARRGVRERARGRGRRVPGAGEVIDTLRLTAEAANDLLATGEVSAAELHAAYVAAIERHNPELNAFLEVVQRRTGRASRSRSRT